MKSAFTLAAIAAMATASFDYDAFFDSLPEVDVDQFEEKTFDNLIDHFNFLDDRTYAQRYWVSD